LVIYCQTTAHASRVVLLTIPRVGRSYELVPGGFYLHLLLSGRPFMLPIHIEIYIYTYVNIYIYI